MAHETGSAAVATDDAQNRGNAAQERSVELTGEFARSRVEAAQAMRELQRAIMAGVDLGALATAAEGASHATGRLAGFARMLSATLQKMT
jgi:hypothetical protein